MGEHEPATGWTVGQIGELLAITARSLGPALKGRDPKEVLKKLGKNGELFANGLSRLVGEIIDGESLGQNAVEETVKVTLRRITTPEPLKIKACSGGRIISEQKGLFQAGIDPDFQNLGIDKKGSVTEAVEASVYELVENATFAEMLAFFSKNPNELYFEQDQVISFIEEYRQYLSTGGATFFPFRCDGKFFGARVSVDSGGRLFVRVDRAEDSSVWFAGYRLRLVVPQLAA